MSRLKNKNGFTLLELTLAMVIIFVLIAGVYVYYKSTRGSGEVTREVENIYTIRAKIEQYYQNSGRNYTGLANQLLIDSHAIPTDMVQSGVVGGVGNQWGGQVTVTPGTSVGLTNQAFVITYSGVPDELTVSLASAAGVNFYRVDVNGVVVKAIGASNINTGTLTNAATQANGGDTVSWIVM